MNLDWIKSTPIAHRGLHNAKNPENTLQAFEDACKKGYIIELDVHSLADDTIVVYHDHNLLRLCNQNVEIESLTHEQLSNLTILDTDHTIPTLQEVLDLVNGRVPIIIELKSNKLKDNLPEKVYNITKNYSGPYAVKSFNHVIMSWFAKNAPEVPRGMLGSSLKGENKPWIYKYIIKNLSLAPMVKPNFISYDHHELSNRALYKFRKKNLPILAWTIRSEQEAKNVQGLADNIIFEDYIPS